MKLSVSLPREDVEFLDRYVANQDFGSRSAALHEAVRLLRAAELGPAYERARADCGAQDSDLWDSTSGDGLA
jgi:Arc/MetJ-type ribon-helix-helix transcriptional regulator